MAGDCRALGDEFEALRWEAWGSFHLGDFSRAAYLYEDMDARGVAAVYEDEKNARGSGSDGESTESCGGSASARLCRAACLLHMNEDAQAVALATSAPDCGLRRRLLFAAACRAGDEAGVRGRLAELGGGAVDQLALAAAHFHRGHFNEAIDTLKGVLVKHGGAGGAATGEAAPF